MLARNRILLVIILYAISLKKIEGKNVVKQGTYVKYTAQILPEVEKFARLEAMLENFTDTAQIYQRPESSREKILKNLQNIPEVKAVIEECRKFHVPLVCKDSPYRSIDGSCNNLKHPEWGKAITEQRRLLPANYEGTNGFRKSVSGKKLPNARSISLTMPDVKKPFFLTSTLYVYFSQFLTHDMILTPVMTENGEAPNCCDPSKKSDPFCAQNDIPAGDPFYSQYNVTCLDFNRAAPYPRCNFTEKRGVFNKKSSFIDASQIYDNSEERAKSLRMNDGTGRLRTQDSNFGILMPKNYNNKALFCPVAAIQKCFDGGDDRVNQHSFLIVLQTVFLRLHNNIADSLKQLNPNWDDEKLYQEARRIVIALVQKIVYTEFLSLVIGPEGMDKLGLDCSRSSKYNDEVDPSILVEFSSSAFRAHSMVPTLISGTMPKLKIRNTYSNVQLIHNGKLDSMLVGASEVPSESQDQYMTEDVSNFLFKAPGETYGSDLTVKDILRGRDVGLPTYTEMLRFCSNGTVQINDFQDLSNYDVMKLEDQNVLMGIYENVHDIDFFAGALRQTYKETTATADVCIVAIQFYRLKFGDSFFFTHSNGRNPFSTGQMSVLRSYSLARIICETTEVEKVRISPLRNPSTENPLKLCSSFPPMDLLPWKE